MFPIRNYIPETGTVIQHSFLGPPALPRVLQATESYCTGNRRKVGTCSTDSTYRRYYVVHEEAVSKVRVTNAGSSQNYLLSMAHTCGKAGPHGCVLSLMTLD